MKRISKADYYDTIVLAGARSFIVVIDLDMGGMSVTNDIDNVIAEIIDRRKAGKKEDYLFIYRDSTGLCDGYDVRTKYFIPFREIDAKAAIQSYVLMLIREFQAN